MPVDRNSFVPPYAQVSESLERHIAAGDYRVGDRLPSEAEICRVYNVSRMTARKAISVLLERGLARSERGRGVFVEPLGISQAQFNLDGLREVFAAADIDVRMLESTSVEADKTLAKELRVKVGTDVIHLRRQLLRAGHPIVLHEAYVLEDPDLGLMEAERGTAYLRGLLDSGAADSPYRSGIVELQIDVLDAPTAELLEETEGSPAWVLEHTFYDLDGRTLSWGRFVLPRHLLHFPTRIGLASAAIDG